jgi:hypothetical protein
MHVVVEEMIEEVVVKEEVAEEIAEANQILKVFNKNTVTCYNRKEQNTEKRRKEGSVKLPSVEQLWLLVHLDSKHLSPFG